MDVEQASTVMTALADGLRDRGSPEFIRAVDAIKDFLQLRAREERVILPVNRQLRVTVLGVPVYDDELDLDSSAFRQVLCARAVALGIQLPKPG